MSEKNYEVENNEAIEEVEDQVFTEDVFEIEFKKPIEYNGKKYERMKFDFEKLTGDDALNIEAELRDLNVIVINPAVTSEYLVRVSAKAAEAPIGADFFKLTSLKEFNRITGFARSFLLR